MVTYAHVFSDFQSYRTANKSISISFRVEFDFDVCLIIAPQKPNQNVEKHMFKTKKIQAIFFDVGKLNVRNRLKRVLAKFEADRSHV